MITFDHVEEYLEALAGHIDLVTKKPISSWLYTFEPIINLARYDVKVLESMTMAVTQSQALTERQGELLVKIILKYERQLANKSINIDSVRIPKWRIPLRKMDYTRTIKIVDNVLHVKFPFDEKLIDSIKEFSKLSQGFARWNRENKLWEIALTEFNISWLHTWANLNQFEIDTAVQQHMDKIKTVEVSNYAIELYVDDDRLAIRNCPDSLSDYIKNKYGTLELDKLLTLIDISAILGYTIDKDLADAVVAEYGPRFYNLAVSRESKINPNTLTTSDDFESVVTYAEQVDRWPVILYEPDLSNRFLEKILAIRPDAAVYKVAKKTDRIPTDVKYVYTQVPIRTMESIPLVVSSAGMVFGGDKQLMIQRAEKIVYCAVDVYNKRSPKSKVTDIAS
jgi:hypothetical protein